MPANIKRQYTNNRLNDINFNYGKVLKSIKSLDLNIAHDHDGVPIIMFKLSCPSIIKPFLIIFLHCLKSGTIPEDWKQGNVVPVYEKDNKQTVNNYRPLSLLPICSKIFGKLIFNLIFEFFYHSAYSINSSIFSAFDANPSSELCCVFLDLSKTFDRVWHEVLPDKLQNSGINGNLLDLIESFLHNRR